jgi:O-antigen/teichoic acid export membrane protein
MTVSFAVSDTARALVGFVTSLVVARGLGVDEFGRWMLCLAVASAIGIVLDLGYGVLLTREAARNHGGLGDVLAGAIATRLMLLLPVAGIVIAAGPLGGGGPELSNALAAIVAIAGAGAIYGCFAGVLRGRAEWLAAALGVDIGGAILQCAAATWVASTGGTYVRLLWWFAAVQAAQLLAAAIMWRCRRRTEQRLRQPVLGSLVPLLGRAWPLALSGIVANAQMRVAPLVLGALSTSGHVALFGVAWRIGNLIKVLPNAAFAAALPTFAHAADAAALRPRFDATLVWFAAAASAAVGIGAAPLVRLTYGGEFATASVPLLWIGAWILPSIVNAGRKVYLIALGDERISLRWTSVALALQAAGCAALVPAFGASGAAAAMTIGEAAVWWPLRAAVSRRPEAFASQRPIGGTATHPAPIM